jgi:tRNA pseudouridine38-40 synthase
VTSRAADAQRIRLLIAYDGAPFSGWQRQPGGKSIQALLEHALEKTIGIATPLHGSGRTDAGVHALGQVAHFDAPGARLTNDEWVAALNARLPLEIRILRATRVPETFHARFSAVEKTYVYRIWTARVLPPHEARRAWHLPQSLDDAVLRRALQLYVGEQDFAAFAANRRPAKRIQPPGLGLGRGVHVTSTVREMTDVRLTRRGPLITIRYTANGFLYRMVRLLTGGAMRCALSKMPLEDLTRYLQEPGKGKCSHCAPADGLYLARVRY